MNTINSVFTVGRNILSGRYCKPIKIEIYMNMNEGKKARDQTICYTWLIKIKVSRFVYIYIVIEMVRHFYIIHIVTFKLTESNIWYIRTWFDLNFYTDKAVGAVNLENMIKQISSNALCIFLRFHVVFYVLLFYKNIYIIFKYKITYYMDTFSM